MAFTILKKRTSRTVGIITALIVTSGVIYAFLSSYTKIKNKAAEIPEVTLVEAAIYTEKGAAIPILYAAVPSEECIKQLSFAVIASSSMAASQSSFTSQVSESSQPRVVADTAISSVASSIKRVKKASSKSSQPAPEPAMVNASAPKCIQVATPPEGYQQLGEENFVTLSLNLTEAGRVERGEVEKSSGFADLDAAALKQVTETWQFEPCTKANRAVACRQYIRFRWQDN